MIKATTYVLAGFALAFAFFVTVGAALGGCASTPTAVTATAAQQADVAAYAAEELACVSVAAEHDAGLDSANACIAGVKSRWCGDGGQLAGNCGGSK